MSSGRIELPLEEYNSMKSKIEEYEKTISSISKDITRYKEENKEMKSFISEVMDTKASERIFSWENFKEKAETFLNKV